MSLTFKPIVETKPEPKLIRLPKSFLPQIREYAAAIAAKKEAEKAARNAENVIKSLKATIVAAMDGQASAVCEHVVLTAKTSADAAPSLTMCDGSTVKWELVSGLTIGNRYIAREDIKSIYGGRSGSLQLDVTGA
jgi:hypothetical protein